MAKGLCFLPNLRINKPSPPRCAPVVHHSLLGAVCGCIIETPPPDGPPGPVMHLLSIKLEGSQSLYFHYIYARINFCS